MLKGKQVEMNRVMEVSIANTFKLHDHINKEKS